MLGDCARRLSAIDGDLPALRWHGAVVSYGELRQLADAARTTIDGLGLADGEPVGLLVKKSPEAIGLVLACLLTGRPFLLPPADIGVEVRNVLFSRAGCRVVLRAGDAAAENLAEPAGSPDLTGVGFMLTTSGSTGVPKVVPLPGKAVDAFTEWAAGELGVGPGTTVLSYAPLNFDLSLLDVWTTLSRGGQVVLVDQDHGLDAGRLLRTFTDDVEIVQAVPMFYRLIVDAIGRSGQAFSRVREVVSTGDSMAPALVAALPTVFPNARFRNIYGCTETNDSFVADIDPASGRNAPIGRPIPGVHAVVVDQRGRLVTGVGNGELWVSTPFQSGRYLDPELTAHSWVDAPPGAPPGKYFRSGDNVRRDADGVFWLDGRADFQLKVRGVRTNLQEVERVVLTHPSVADVVVLGIPDDVAGHLLHAVVQRRPSAALNSLQLRSHCADRLPRTAIPSSVDIVADPFPRNANGKVDRQKIAEGVRGRVPSR